MDNTKFSLEEQALICALVSNRYGYLQREYLRNFRDLKHCSDDTEGFERIRLQQIIDSDKERIDLCLSILSKIKGIY